MAGDKCPDKSTESPTPPFPVSAWKWFLWQSGCFQPGNVLYQGEVWITASVWWENPWGCWCSLSQVSPGVTADQPRPANILDTRTPPGTACLLWLGWTSSSSALTTFPFWNSTLASNSIHRSPGRSCCPRPSLGTAGGSVGRGCRVAAQHKAISAQCPAEGCKRAQTKEPRCVYPLAHWPVHIYLFGYVLRRYLYIYIYNFEMF